MQFLALVSDSTRTQAMLADEQGRRLAVTSRENHRSDSSRALLRAVLDGLTPEQPSPLTAVAALPNLATEAHRGAAARLLRELLPGDARLLLCDRWEAVLAGGLECQAGMVVFSGCDAAAARVDDLGNFTRVESPGELLGAEGSGLWLGTRALQLAGRMMAGRMALSGRLERALLEQFGCRTLGELVDRVDGAGLETFEVAALGALVVDLAGYPDPVPACRALVLQASRHLNLLAATVAAEEQELSVTWGGCAMRGTLLQELRKSLPVASWNPPRKQELEGCMMLALGAARGGSRAAGQVGQVDRDLWQAVLRR